MPSPTIIKIFPNSFNPFRMACRIWEVNEIAFCNEKTSPKTFAFKVGRIQSAQNVAAQDANAGIIHGINGETLIVAGGGSGGRRQRQGRKPP